MRSLAAQPLCLSQYPVTKNAQNSAVCVEGTEFHWPKEAFGKCSSVFFLCFGTRPLGFKTIQKADPGAMNNAVRFLHWMGTLVQCVRFSDSSLHDITLW